MQVHCGSRPAPPAPADADAAPWPCPWLWLWPAAPAEPCDGDAGVELVRRFTDTLRWLFWRPESRRSEYDDDAFRENLNAGLCNTRKKQKNNSRYAPNNNTPFEITLHYQPDT